MAEFAAGTKKETDSTLVKASLIWEGLRSFMRDGSTHSTLAHFKTIDADGSGSLDRGEFKKAIELAGYPDATDAEMDAVMRMADMDTDGDIDYNEFVAALVQAEIRHRKKAKAQVREEAELAWEALRAFARDGAKAKTGFFTGSTLSHFKEIDADGDGKLGRDEVAAAVQRLEGLAAQPSEMVVDQIMRMADADDNGALDYDEFVAALVKAERRHRAKVKAALAAEEARAQAAHAAASQSVHEANVEAAQAIWEGLRAFARDGDTGSTLDHFKRIDADGSGTLDRGEFKQAVAMVGYPDASDGVVTEVMKLADLDTDGEIDYNEFVGALVKAEMRHRKQLMSNAKAQKVAASLSSNKHEAAKATVRAAVIWEGLRAFARNGGRGATMAHFKELDLDGNGSIDRQEFKAAIGKVGFPNSSDMVLDAVMLLADMDTDGEIDYQEFVLALMDAEKRHRTKTNHKHKHGSH